MAERERSILFPTKQQVSDRKYHEAGVRGRFETNLRIERGRIGTTTPSIFEGVGFTLSKNGTGDVTITFDPPFSANPSLVPGSEGSPPSALSVTTLSTSQVRVIRTDLAGGAVDGNLSFIVCGPA